MFVRSVLVVKSEMDFCDGTSSDYCIRQPIMVHVLHSRTDCFRVPLICGRFEHRSMFATGALFLRGVFVDGVYRDLT